MTVTQRLNLGLVCGNGIKDKVVKEVLNHQGLPLQNIVVSSRKREKLPCAILPNYSDENFELAKKNCLSEDGIIVVEKHFPTDLVLKALSGQLEAPIGDPVNPAINQYEVELVAKIKEKYANLGLPLIRKWFWPHFHDACCVMTHDIDWLYYSPWHWAVLRRKSIPQVIELAYQSILKKKNFGNNVSQIILTEIRRTIRSTFFFLPKYEEEYKEKFLRYLKDLQKHGFEIGLHGHYSHDNLARLKEQKAMLVRYVKTKVKGIRQHELNFLAPLTWKYEDEAGFIYDLTFGYNDKFGFRSGICFPYHPINALENRRFSIIEMPTSFMDWTVLRRKMGFEEASGVFALLRENVEKFHGLLVTCFHNTYLNEETFPEIYKLYCSIFNDLSQRNYWITTADQCCQWWLKREKTRINAKIKGKSIIGETSTYPIPLLVETARGERKRAEIYGKQFKVDLA